MSSNPLADNSRPAASPLVIKFGDRDILLHGLTPADLGVIGNHLISQRPNPLSVAGKAALDIKLLAMRRAAKLPEAEAKSALEAANEIISRMMGEAFAEIQRESTVEETEIRKYMGTVRGLAFTYWVVLERTYPGEFSLKDAYAMLEQINKEGQIQGSPSGTASSGAQNETGQGAIDSRQQLQPVGA